MKTLRFKYKNKKISIKYKECNSLFSKALGLMFRKNSSPLLFTFKKPIKISIHSFFCKPFIVIWLLHNKIIDVKLVKPNKFSIKSKNKFDKILEIPSNNKKFLTFYKLVQVNL